MHLEESWRLVSSETNKIWRRYLINGVDTIKWRKATHELAFNWHFVSLGMQLCAYIYMHKTKGASQNWYRRQMHMWTTISCISAKDVAQSLDDSVLHWNQEINPNNDIHIHIHEYIQKVNRKRNSIFSMTGWKYDGERFSGACFMGETNEVP